jgi:hypothetical protein
MPEEIFVIIMFSMFVGMVLGTVRMVLNYKQARLDARSPHPALSPADNSLTTSELQHLLRKAVEEGTRPLVARIEALEEALAEPPALPGSSSRLLGKSKGES